MVIRNQCQRPLGQYIKCHFDLGAVIQHPDCLSIRAGCVVAHPPTVHMYFLDAVRPFPSFWKLDAVDRIITEETPATYGSDRILSWFISLDETLVNVDLLLWFLHNTFWHRTTPGVLWTLQKLNQKCGDKSDTAHVFRLIIKGAIWWMRVTVYFCFWFSFLCIFCIQKRIFRYPTKHSFCTDTIITIQFIQTWKLLRETKKLKRQHEIKIHSDFYYWGTSFRIVVKPVFEIPNTAWIRVDYAMQMEKHKRWRHRGKREQPQTDTPLHPHTSMQVKAYR